MDDILRQKTICCWEARNTQRCAFFQETSRGLTCADQCAVVVQRSQVWPWQREESVQFGQIAAEARPRQHRADDDVPQRVADEAVGRRQTTFRERNLQHEWAAGKKKCLQRCWPTTLPDSFGRFLWKQERVAAEAIWRFLLQHAVITENSLTP